MPINRDRRGMHACGLLVVSALLLAGCQPSAEQRVSRAHAFYSASDYTGAVIELKNALRSEPGNADARLLLAEASAKIGDYATAVSEYERALSGGRDEEAVWLGFGRALLNMGRAEEVIERVLPALESGDASVETLVLEGDVMNRLGNSGNAEVAFNKALELEADREEALLGLAVVAAARGDTDGALALVDSAVEKYPESALSWRTMGNLRRTLGDFTGAADAYAVAMQNEEASTPLADMFATRANLVGTLTDARAFDEAQSQLVEMRKVLPGHPLISFLQGRISYGLGNYSDAQTQLQEYLSNVPRDYRGHAMLGAVNFSQNYLRQAEMFLRQAVNRDPDSDQTRRLLAETQLRLSKPGAAVESLGGINDDDLNDPDLLNLMGRAQLALGNNDSAIRYLRQGADLDPANSSGSLSLAGGLLASDRAAEAIEVLQASPPYQDADFMRETLLAAAYLSLGQEQDALQVIDKMTLDNQDNANAFAIAGHLQQSLGDVVAAQGAYRQALELDSGSLPALFGLGRMAESSGDDAMAQSWFEKILDIDPGYLPALVYLGKIRSETDLPIDLAPRMEEAIDASGGALMPYVIYARVMVEAGNFKKALDIVSEASRLHKNEPLLDHVEALALLNSGSTEAGMRKLSQAASADPDSAIIARDLARYRLAQREFAGAENAAERFRQLEPASLTGLALQTEAMSRNNNAATARKALEAYRAQYGDSIDLDLIAGDIEIFSGDAVAAVRYYERAAQRIWARPVVTRLVGAQRRTNPAAAVVTLNRWLDENPSDQDLRRQLAMLLEANGQDDEAERQYEQIIAQNENDAVSLNNLAWQYAQDGRPEALDLARRAYELAPENGSTADTLGWIQYLNGDIEEAIATLRRAVELSPKNGEISFHLAAALNKNGQNDEARTVLSKILASDRQFPSRKEAELLAQSL